MVATRGRQTHARASKCRPRVGQASWRRARKHTHGLMSFLFLPSFLPLTFGPLKFNFSPRACLPVGGGKFYKLEVTRSKLVARRRTANRAELGRVQLSWLAARLASSSGRQSAARLARCPLIDLIGARAISEPARLSNRARAATCAARPAKRSNRLQLVGE